MVIINTLLWFSRFPNSFICWLSDCLYLYLTIVAKNNYSVVNLLACLNIRSIALPVFVFTRYTLPSLAVDFAAWSEGRFTNIWTKSRSCFIAWKARNLQSFKIKLKLVYFLPYISNPQLKIVNRMFRRWRCNMNTKPDFVWSSSTRTPIHVSLIIFAPMSQSLDVSN